MAGCLIREGKLYLQTREVSDINCAVHADRVLQLSADEPWEVQFYPVGLPDPFPTAPLFEAES